MQNKLEGIPIRRLPRKIREKALEEIRCSNTLKMTFYHIFQQSNKYIKYSIFSDNTYYPLLWYMFYSKGLTNYILKHINEYNDKKAP